MTDSLRDQIAAAMQSADRRLALEEEMPIGLYYARMADAVMEIITVHIPPILASTIRSYADSQLVALDYHGDGSAIEELRQLSREAAKIAHYATTHERWSGGKPA